MTIGWLGSPDASPSISWPYCSSASMSCVISPASSRSSSSLQSCSYWAANSGWNSTLATASVWHQINIVATPFCGPPVPAPRPLPTVATSLPGTGCAALVVEDVRGAGHVVGNEEAADVRRVGSVVPAVGSILSPEGPRSERLVDGIPDTRRGFIGVREKCTRRVRTAAYQ